MKWVISKEKWYHHNDGDIDPADIILLTQDEYDSLMQEYSKGGREFYVDSSGILTLRGVLRYSDEYYNSLQIDDSASSNLNTTDWKVIRELERLYLNGTELNIQREQWRASITRLDTPIAHRDDINSKE